MSPVQEALLSFEETPGDFAAYLGEFSEFGEKTRVDVVNGLRYFTNEYWTARQRQANRIHEVSYRACFKPQLPAFFIEKLTQQDEIVYDPFMGRGTTLVEAALRGRTPFGNDINPVSKAMTKPRLNPPHFSEIEKRLAEVPWGDFTEVSHEELTAFFHHRTLAEVEGLRGWLMERERCEEQDSVDEWLRMVAINRLTGHSSGFFSVYTMPPNQAVSIESQIQINKKRNQVPPYRNVAEIIRRKSRNLLSQLQPRAESHLLLVGRSDDTPDIPDAVVALTVTSPPFLDIVDYTADNWLRCWFLGISPEEVEISKHSNVDEWRDFVAKTLAELSRITRVGGHVAFEVGEVRNGTIQLEELVIDAAEGLPMEAIGVMVNQQVFTKTSNCWGITNNQRGTNSNRIVLFKRTND